MTVLYGNSFVERLQEDGAFEAYLHAANPGKKQQFRSLAYTGDQLHFRIRASRFGTHLSYLVDQWKSDRVIMCFGAYEAMVGQAGLEKFKKDLVGYIDLIKTRHPENEYVLVSPLAVEGDHSTFFPDADSRNRDVKLYVDAMQKIAREKGVVFIDLYSVSRNLFAQATVSLTHDGVNLNARGSRLVGIELAKILQGSDKVSVDVSGKAFTHLAKMVARKAEEVAQAYHPANGISYYGIRARSYEYQPEIPHYLKVANILDEAIWKQAKDLNRVITFPEIPVLRVEMPSKKPKNGLGVVKTSKEDLKDFTLLDGFEVNCFASSEDYPELINPLQIRFDAKGRLWVACFASYPHPLPGAIANDKILIFEDTDGDGKADKKIVFADKLRLPDGFVFYKDGIIASVSRKLIYLADKDGDDVADVREEMLRGLDDTDTHHSGYLSRTPQGRVMVSEALFHRGQMETPHGVVHTKDTVILSFDPESRRLITERQSMEPNPWKISFDGWGESIQFFGGGQIHDADIYNVWSPMGYAAPGALGMPFRYDKGCTCEIVESAHFPKEWQGGLLTGHLLKTNEINFTPLKLVDGAKKAAGKKQRLISSKNKIFRPSDMAFALDGALYISDFYYPIIGHAQHSIRDKNRDYANGRIWRITKKGNRLLKAPNIVGAPSDQLLKLLYHPHLRTRELVRVELEKHDREKVLAAIQNVRSRIKMNNRYSLEILWLYERLGYFEDVDFLKNMLQHQDIRVRRAAVRSLRYWAKVLGNDLKPIIAKLAKSSDERLKIALVGVIAHLQREDASLLNELDDIQAKEKTPLAHAKRIASWGQRKGLSPEIPLLRLSPVTVLKGWSGAKNDGVLYLMSDREQEVVISHRDNAFMNIDVNDVPIVIASGSILTTESQSNVLLHQGINKIRYHFRRGHAHLNLSDKLGYVPPGVTYVTGDKVAAVAKQFEILQTKQWKTFAEKTFQQNCANCHSIEGHKAVGPPLNRLFGKTQTVIDAKGNKRQVTVDEDYIREAIVNPMSVYPEGQQPTMPKMPLNGKEVDNLVRWIRQLN